MPEKTAEQLEKEWWDRWWAEDWSWDGLADKTVEIGSNLGLQEYWSNEKDNLFPNPEGTEHYTRFHLPFAWQDGRPTEKASWSDEQHQALADDLAAILENHRGTDNPAMFHGVVLKIVPKMPEVSNDEDASDERHPASVIFDDAWLRARTTWSTQVFANASFDRATFSGQASFTSATFSGEASFYRATFSGQALFYRATFSGQAFFVSATFSGEASFGSTTFEIGDERRARLSFRDATFAENVEFRPYAFPVEPAYAAKAFSGAKFELRADFDSKAFFAPAAFDGAILERSLRLYKDHIDRPGRATPPKMKEVVEKACTDGLGDKDDVLRSIADGARTLQKAMADARHNDAEQLFHRLEVMARQARRKWWAPRRWLTSIYAQTSDYGGSIGRPLASVFSVWLVLAVTFWFWHAKPSPTCEGEPLECAWIARFDDFEAAATFSARNVFRPFHVWSVTPRSFESFDQQLLFRPALANNPNTEQQIRPRLLVRIVSTVQSFFSVIMLFLTVLAARRYYQLS
ncbi:MAG: pentapeptide repeat-containing protein [Pseudomonadota bacterium]